MQIRYGSSRTVILAHKWAIKVPAICGWRNFLLGILANLQEAQFSKTGWPELCPVVWRLPFGFLICMRRAMPLAMSEFELFDFDAFVNREDYVIPVENKLDSFGKLNGRIVAIDYGN